MLFGCLGGCQKGWTLGAPIRVWCLCISLLPSLETSEMSTEFYFVDDQKC